MSRHNPYNLQMQISRMFRDGQSIFASIKVQEWLKERNQDPADYRIVFHKVPAPPGSGLVEAIQVELQRKDGDPVDEWLATEVNRSV